MLLNEKEAEGRYRLRLLEATFSNIEFIELFTKGIPTEVLVGMEIQIGKQKAIRVEFGEKEEANALVTLLRIYETKSTAQFHVVLKMLCDLYGLRKDTFDRVANEQEYLKNMNSARTDKARMLDYALPGTIIEIGPGGGVVLDLISKRFPGSDIIGIDVSQEVVDALNERALRENATSQIRFGDAFELPTLIPDGYDTVIFCSILHEIYSYVVDPKSGKKFEKSNCYTWGPASFPYEVREQYGILNYADYISEIHDWLDAEDLNAKSEKRENWKRHCVEIPKAHQSYLQPGYKTGLASKVILLDENMNPVELPDSNCLIVFEKT